MATSASATAATAAARRQATCINANDCALGLAQLVARVEQTLGSMLGSTPSRALGNVRAELVALAAAPTLVAATSLSAHVATASAARLGASATLVRCAKLRAAGAKLCCKHHRSNGNRLLGLLVNAENVACLLAHLAQSLAQALALSLASLCRAPCQSSSQTGTRLSATAVNLQRQPTTALDALALAAALVKRLAHGLKGGHAHHVGQHSCDLLGRLLHNLGNTAHSGALVLLQRLAGLVAAILVLARRVTSQEASATLLSSLASASTLGLLHRFANTLAALLVSAAVQSLAQATALARLATIGASTTTTAAGAASSVAQTTTSAANAATYASHSIAQTTARTTSAIAKAASGSANTAACTTQTSSDTAAGSANATTGATNTVANAATDTATSAAQATSGTANTAASATKTSSNAAAKRAYASSSVTAITITSGTVATVASSTAVASVAVSGAPVALVSVGTQVVLLGVLLAALLASLLHLLLHLLLARLDFAKACNAVALLALVLQSLNALVLSLAHSHLATLHWLGKLGHQLDDGRHLSAPGSAALNFSLLANRLLLDASLCPSLGLPDNVLQRLRHTVTGLGRGDDFVLLSPHLHSSRPMRPMMPPRLSQHQCDQQHESHLHHLTGEDGKLFFFSPSRSFSFFRSVPSLVPSLPRDYSLTLRMKPSCALFFRQTRVWLIRVQVRALLPVSCVAALTCSTCLVVLSFFPVSFFSPSSCRSSRLAFTPVTLASLLQKTSRCNDLLPACSCAAWSFGLWRRGTEASLACPGHVLPSSPEHPGPPSQPHSCSGGGAEPHPVRHP